MSAGRALGPQAWRLFTAQLGLVVLVGIGLGLARTLAPDLAWSAWIPGAAWILGAAAYVWRLAPDQALTDREEVRALAVGSGRRLAGLVAILALVWVAARPEGSPGLGVGLLLAAVGSFGAFVGGTILTLVGLDLGRTPFQPPSTHP